jgi:methyl-accepting chemotaxis protein
MKNIFQHIKLFYEKKIIRRLHNPNTKISVKLYIVFGTITLIYLMIGILCFFSIDRNLNNGIYLFLILMSISALISFFLVRLLIPVFLKPLKLITQAIENVANGDFTQTINEERKDEFGVLIEASNQMIIQFQNIVESITDGVESFASVSNIMNVSSQEISQGANEQAAAVEQVTASMEQMLANIEQNSLNSQQTEESASLTAQKIEESNKKVQQTAEMMKEIAKKIDVINDIAFQTNILSLNATIESARVGSLGKGFAVVASEVGRLAENSKQAALEIEKMSRSGLSISEEAGHMIDELVPEIENTASLVMNIAIAGSEQETGAKQINVSIIQLSEVIQANAAAAEEMATNSEELASQAAMLKELITFFKTVNDKKEHYTIV